MSAKPKLTMIILDGWGYAAKGPGNAIEQAYKPNFDKAFRECPHTTLEASGESVGLPDKQVGNSEAGHINLGAGRVEQQDLVDVNEAIESGDFFENKALKKAFCHVKARKSRLHLMGLLGYGGVHSWQGHIYALLKMAKQNGIKEIFLHLFTDGQDTPERSALGFLEELEDKMDEMNVGRVASVSGRFYAMDRIENWERSAIVYDTIVHGHDPVFPSARVAIEDAYQQGTTDSFIKPTIIVPKGQKPVEVKPHDAMVFFNLRSDRARQLTKAFTASSFSGFSRGGFIKDLMFVAFSDYGKDLPVETAFDTPPVVNPLDAVLDSHKIKQLYIAEAEKYPHVTYFFHGSSAQRLPTEDWVMVPSLQVRSYKSHPEMQIAKVSEEVIKDIKQDAHDFVLVNFANPDMVGHTGDLKAAVGAVETVDHHVGKVIEACRQQKRRVIVTADHGNADEMIIPQSDQPSTSHSGNPVPFIMVCPDRQNRKLNDGGVLGNVAPTVLDLLEIDPPDVMSMSSLIS